MVYEGSIESAQEWNSLSLSLVARVGWRWRRGWRRRRRWRRRWRRRRGWRWRWLSRRRGLAGCRRSHRSSSTWFSSLRCRHRSSSAWFSGHRHDDSRTPSRNVRGSMTPIITRRFWSIAFYSGASTSRPLRNGGGNRGRALASSRKTVRWHESRNRSRNQVERDEGSFELHCEEIGRAHV